MTQPKHTITILSDDDGQVFLHADSEGLSQLINSLKWIKKKVDEGVCEHDHMFSDSWAGNELSVPETHDENEKIVHHLKIYGWTSEWVQKHGLNYDDKA